MVSFDFVKGPWLNKSSKTFMEQEAVRSENKEERDVVSPWDVPLEIRRILGLENETPRRVYDSNSKNEQT